MYTWEMFKKILFFILLEISLVSAMNINEIMYDFPGSDNNHEWIEIYNNGSESINISKWKLFEEGASHSLNIKQGSSILNPNEYAIIAQDNTTFLKDNPTYSKILLTSSFSLSNSGETISIKDDKSSIIDTLTYSDSLKGNGNNNTLCLYENKLQECISTPGYENNISKIIEQDFSKIKISEFFPNPIGEDNAPMPGGEFVEIYNPNAIAIDLQGLKLKDNTNHTILISDMNTISGTIIQPNLYLAVYMNGFSGLLNNEGLEIIKLYNLENNLIDELTYSFSEEGLTWSKVNNFWQLRFPSPNEENRKDEPIYKSSIKIENIYLGTDKKVKFGEDLRIRIKVYKGNTSKETIKIYAVTLKDEQISKQTTTNLENKFTNYTLTLPIQLEPNCKHKYPDGTYKIILEGLNANASEELEIAGITTSLCQIVKENITKEIHYEIISMPGELKIGEPINYEIKILNDENQKTQFEAWSYVLKGTKIITGEEKANLQTLDLPAGSSATVNLENELSEDIESGEYTIKIKLLKENRVRPIVIDSKINVQGEIKQNNIPQETNLGTGETVYLSASQKAKNSAVYLFIGLLLLITIVLIIKKSH